MTTITLHVTNESFLPTLKQFLLNVKGVKIAEESMYDSKFVAKIKASEIEAQMGKIHKIETKDLWK